MTEQRSGILGQELTLRQSADTLTLGGIGGGVAAGAIDLPAGGPMSEEHELTVGVYPVGLLEVYAGMYTGAAVACMATKAAVYGVNRLRSTRSRV